MLNKELEITVKGNSYKVKFPNVGQYIDLQAMKMSLSSNQYGSMERSFHPSMQRALNMVDVEAIFTVLCPELIKDLVPTSFSDMGLADYRELEEVYKAKVIPWWEQIEEIFVPQKEETDNGSEAK